MSRDRRRLEHRVATVLQFGTWTGSGLVALGWVLSATGEPRSLPGAGATAVWSGITLFILLPALRVLLMGVAFVRQRDWRLSAIAALVLTLIVVGAALGMRGAGVVAG
jgi:uncharacterized membrane protein YhaH (DUF805 family)